MTQTTRITVIKRNAQGETVVKYPGVVVDRGATWVCIRARFGMQDMELGYVTLRRGDRFTEWFYADRWYNVFRVQDVDTGALKGWYCNFTRPAEIQADSVAADDLELDAFIKPDGTWLLLDQQEFNALDISDEEREAVKHAVWEVRQRVEQRRPPFDEIP